jgi:hypothetical protein
VLFSNLGAFVIIQNMPALLHVYNFFTLERVSLFIIKPYELELNGQCTLQNTWEVNVCPLLCTFMVMAVVDVWFSQRHAGC